MIQKNLSHESTAWLPMGMTGADLGTLKVDGKRLQYLTDNNNLTFDISLQDLRDIKFPWYYFGCGFKAKIPQGEVRISFCAPNGSVDPDHLDETLTGSSRGGFIVLSNSFKHIRFGRERMALWKQILSNSNIL